MVNTNVTVPLVINIMLPELPDAETFVVEAGAMRVVDYEKYLHALEQWRVVCEHTVQTLREVALSQLQGHGRVHSSTDALAGDQVPDVSNPVGQDRCGELDFMQRPCILPKDHDGLHNTGHSPLPAFDR